MTKLELLKTLKASQKLQDAWWDSLPREINMAFVDNPLVDSLYKSQNLLMRVAFGDCYEDASYFINEWKPGYGITEADGTVWDLADESAYHEYFKKVCGE